MTDASISAPAAAQIAPGNAAVITGAASGIGLAAARRFASLGLSVMLADLPGEALDRALDEVRTQATTGTQAQAFACDVADRTSVEALARRSFEAFGRVDVLMNNAAIGANPGRTWEGGDAASWR